MTCGAILGSVILAVAAEACSHGVLHQWLCRGRLRHVSMTPGTGYIGANVRRVLKLHERAGIKTVYARPRNFALGCSVLRDLFDFRLVGGNLSVAQHAFRNRGDGCTLAGVRATVTVQALQSVVSVNLMRIGDGLIGGHSSIHHSKQGYQHRPRERGRA